MARRVKKGQQEVIAPQDAREAHKRNVDILIAALGSANANQFSTFLEANADTLGDLFARAAPILNSAQTLPQERIRQEVLKAAKHITPEEMQTLNLRDTLGIKKLVNDADVAKEAAEREMYDKRSRANFRKAGSNFLNGLSSLGKGAGYVLYSPVALTQATVLPVVNLLAAAGDRAQIPRWQRIAGLGATAGMVLWAGSQDVVDSAPYAKEMTTADSFHAACLATPEMMNGNSIGNAVYAVNFARTATSEREKTAQMIANHGARHSVPAIVLYMISKFETGNFRDLNSRDGTDRTLKYTAEGYFQAIDSTTLDWMKRYGEDTFLYKEAHERLGTASESKQDIILVAAIDRVAGMSNEEIKQALETQRMDGPLFDALNIGKSPFMQAELVALDMKASFPEASDPNISNEQIHALAEKAYVKHFLGPGAQRMLSRLAQTSPDMDLGDHPDPGVVKSVNAWHEANPSMVSPDMTAAENLENIVATFNERTADSYETFIALEQEASSVTDVCLTDEAKSLIPDKISYIEAAMHKSGAYPWWEATIDKAETTWYHLTAAADAAQGMAQKFGLVSEPEATVAAPPARVAQAPSPHAPQTSPRPEPRPRTRIAALEQH